MNAILVHLGCYKKNTIDLKHLFLIDLEAGRSKIKAPADFVCGAEPLLGSEEAKVWLCSHMAA